jgi:hypothetical protein
MSTAEHHWDEAYPLLPAQYAELSRGEAASQPERRLMLAVLSDAIVLFQTRDPKRAGPVRQEFEEAQRWILSNDSLWPYSFVNVCETLGIAYEPLRRALVAERRSQGISTARPAARRRLLAGVTTEAVARTG